MAEKHYFVINQEGKSANRRGPFETVAAAKEWTLKFYRFPCWIVPAEYIGMVEFRPCQADGNYKPRG